VAGDFNGNAQLDAEDLDLLANEIRTNRNVGLFDVNDDSIVDMSDHRFWVHDLSKTYLGDANLDGEFNTTDLVGVFQAGKYEDDVAGNASWTSGDWNGDDDFSTSDLVVAFQDGGFEQGPRAGVNAVPEPSSVMLLFFAVAPLMAVARRPIV
jgi:hypothetical protein